MCVGVVVMGRGGQVSGEAPHCVLSSGSQPHWRRSLSHLLIALSRDHSSLLINNIHCCWKHPHATKIFTAGELRDLWNTVFVDSLLSVCVCELL